jgi:hypothetical protein
MRPVLITLLLLLTLLGTTSCPTNPDTDRKVQAAVKVPGLEEAVLAKDKALKAAILIAWESDPELIQEQLAITDVDAGKVTITGIVSRPELKERAENIAREQDGVNDVLSTITVDETLKDKRIEMGDV